MTDEEERAFSDAMDADRMPSETVEYWLYAALLVENERLREVVDAAHAWREARLSLSADCQRLGISGHTRDTWRWIAERDRREEPLLAVLAANRKDGL